MAAGQPVTRPERRPAVTAGGAATLAFAGVVIAGLGKTWTDMITIPLFTGIIGYVTNRTGVLMVFRPLDFRGLRVPGARSGDVAYQAPRAG